MRSKTHGEVVNEALMLALVNSASAVLIVEGIDDVRFWRARTLESCIIICTDGKANAKKAIDRLNELNFGRHVGVLDRDYDDIGEATSIGRNRIFWDGHSLETILFQSPAGERMLTEVFAPDWVQRLEEREALSFKGIIEKTLEKFGRLRYLHYMRNDGQVEVEALNLYRVFPVGSGTALNHDLLYSEGARAGAIPSAAQGPTKSSEVEGWDARYLVRGHDIGALVNILAREAGLTYPVHLVEGNMRMAYHDEYLRGTSVHADIRAWEAARAPFRVLPP
jgi:hypothetical protein